MRARECLELVARGRSDWEISQLLGIGESTVHKHVESAKRGWTSRSEFYAERFVRSVKTEGTGRMIFFSRSSLERALTQYVAHYHEERNHQQLQNRLLKRVPIALSV